ncbi:hypothetical protein A2738_03255 [Candidatus Nomurabacteria bacterium RIFCSPHIGHO2_01_FULL_42_15]|uniref:UDP-N-acetylmuramoyl-L-alanyl-D-glutamate--2,6-diaminopimelate ligase n=1 Tax=Candidatus Nomurabacteria bacterium RIFCSPHIGHO2_01_FULL_42_15 TaxID=1801742 RepID=A0A1F6VE37_9BACT|nr:MAG: hypothetical protein A2738_03255 [Candidatus Nomurabacteria bacterium RIFCSPHIGHO2_01_FULL_42_15]OGI92926.1 MAG: hypothetical protein A3A99_00060 [Candidatus Nomurabacteria bacterium RIFCSPLOWO2_01_FULL_41_18]
MKNINYKNLRRRFINNLLGFHFFYPYKKLKIIGVTGTNGKTTTATLLYRIATSLGYRAGLISTVEHIIAGELKIAEGNKPSTSPDLPYLNKLLREIVDKKCQYVFMEVTSIALDQNRTAGIKFTGGIFTNLTQDHLDYHKDMEEYFQAKKKFFKMLSKDAFALTNIDDEYGLKMLEGIQTKKSTYSFPARNASSIANAGGENNSDFQGEIKKLDFNGLELDFNGNQIKSKLLGKFNAYNLLAAWSTCQMLGFDMKNVNKILESIAPPVGRFDHFMSKSGVLVIVDYAHTPDALQKVLLTIEEIKSKEGLPRFDGRGRIISVFGCGGDRDVSKRSKMGRIGVALSDIAIFTSDNPRSEDPNKIIADMAAELTSKDMQKVKRIENRSEAIKEAVKSAQRGDIILCAGKGHEDYQEINGVKSHFNDMEELKKAFSV